MKTYVWLHKGATLHPIQSVCFMKPLLDLFVRFMLVLVWWRMSNNVTEGSDLHLETLETFLLISPAPEPAQPSSSSQSPLYRPSASPLPVSIWSSEPSLGIDFPCSSFLKKRETKLDVFSRKNIYKWTGMLSLWALGIYEYVLLWQYRQRECEKILSYLLFFYIFLQKSQTSLDFFLLKFVFQNWQFSEECFFYWAT